MTLSWVTPDCSSYTSQASYYPFVLVYSCSSSPPFFTSSQTKYFVIFLFSISAHFHVMFHVPLFAFRTVAVQEASLSLLLLQIVSVLFHKKPQLLNPCPCQGERRASCINERVSFIRTASPFLFNLAMVHGGCVGLGNECSVSKIMYGICGNRMTEICQRFFFSDSCHSTEGHMFRCNCVCIQAWASWCTYQENRRVNSSVTTHVQLYQPNSAHVSQKCLCSFYPC